MISPLTPIPSGRLGNRLKHLGNGQLLAIQLDLQIKKPATLVFMQELNGDGFTAFGKPAGFTPVDLIQTLLIHRRLVDVFPLQKHRQMVSHSSAVIPRIEPVRYSFLPTLRMVCLRV